jgi:phosphatidylserine decarboxylase
MSEIPAPSLRDRFFVAMQHLLPQHFLSRIVLHVTRIRFRPVKNLLIRSFVRRFKPKMSEAAQPNPLQYESFNAFFTRALNHGARSIDIDPTVLVSPVDGTVSQIGRLDGSKIIQAKGFDYTLEALLDGAPQSPLGTSPLPAGDVTATAAPVPRLQWAERFKGGNFATLYLAPFNYHRIHMPIAGTLRAAWYVPGDLFSVNAVTAAAVPGLFARNERVVCVFEDGQRAFALVLVGALFVGSISTVWHGDVAPRRPRTRVDLPLDSLRAALKLNKGAEMGRFNMGSTVILLTPQDMLDWMPRFVPGASIEVGRMMARLK